MKFNLNISIYLLPLLCQTSSAKYSEPNRRGVPPQGSYEDPKESSKFLYGFQSGGFHSDIEAIPDTSSSYGSSLHYDSASKLVYVTGATYWSYWDRVKHTEESVSDLAQLDHSDCFFAVLDPPTPTSAGGDGDDTSHTMDLVYTRRLGKRGYNEACSAQTIVVSDNGEKKIVQGGYTEEGGILTDTRGWGSPTSKMYGILFSYDLGVISDEFEKPGVSEHLSGARLLNDHRVQYPVAVASNPVMDRSEGEIYTVSISSYLKGPNDDIVRGELPDLTYVEEPSYGQQFAVSIEKIVPKTQEEIAYEEAEAALVSGLIVDGKLRDEALVKDTMKAAWTEQFTPELNRRVISTKHYLRVSDMLYAPHFETERFDILIVAGTTTGFGSIFGDPSLNPDLDDAFPLDTESNFKDGFVSLISTDGLALDAARLSTGVHDVVIHGACIDETEQHSIENVYVVGETMGHLDRDMKRQDLSIDKYGDISKHAFISKISLVTVDELWTRQLGGSLGKDVASYGCAVTPGGEMVYMAGTVSGSDAIRIPASMSETESAGNDDIFVAKYDSETGEQMYVKQHGTSYNDSLAKGRGIVSDKEGNAIILGNTRGSMMRWRENPEGQKITMSPYSDVFVLSVDKETGDMLATSEVDGPPEGYRPRNPNNDEPIYTFDGTDKILGNDIFAISVAAIIALITFLYVGYASIRSRTADKRAHNMTLEYLEDFSDRDFNLHTKTSATGGVHGVYSERYPDLSNNQMDRVPPTQRSPRTSSRGYSRTLSSIDEDISEIMSETRRFSSPNKANSEPAMMTTIDLLSGPSPPSPRKLNAMPNTPTNSLAASNAIPAEGQFPPSEMFLDEKLPSANTNESVLSYTTDEKSVESGSMSFGEII